jgi:hypothetical protein
MQDVRFILVLDELAVVYEEYRGVFLAGYEGYRQVSSRACARPFV